MPAVFDITLRDDSDASFSRARGDVVRDAAQAVPLSRVSDRYGEAGEAGWLPVPDVLLFHQSKLSIQSDDLVVLLNLMAHYYVKEEMPFIRPTTIAKRMGVSQRSVQRSIARLRKQGLILKRKHPTNGHITHDLTPLIERLQPLARTRIETRRGLREQRNVPQLDRGPGI